ncbi:MAG: class I SAM-dependent methyltransferase [Mycobacteriales bacterium]
MSLRWSRRPGQRVPALLMHNWAIKKVSREKIEAALDTYASGRLIDVGCGVKPHQKFLANRVSEHVGIDLEDGTHGTAAVDRIGSAYETGEPDGKADTVLLSQVFEHLEEPAKGLDESYRILTPGGHLVLSTDFAWHLHEEPRDFFRYSPYGLRYLVEQAGFEVLAVQPVTGAWFLLFQEAAYAVRRIARRNPLALALSLPLTHILQGLALLGDRVVFDKGFSQGYIIVGRKPDPAAAPRAAAG